MFLKTSLFVLFCFSLLGSEHIYLKAPDLSRDRLILGGVYEPGEEETVIDPNVLDVILENARKSLSGELGSF